MRILVEMAILHRAVNGFSDICHGVPVRFKAGDVDSEDGPSVEGVVTHIRRLVFARVSKEESAIRCVDDLCMKIRFPKVGGRGKWTVRGGGSC